MDYSKAAVKSRESYKKFKTFVGGSGVSKSTATYDDGSLRAATPDVPGYSGRPRGGKMNVKRGNY